MLDTADKRAAAVGFALPWMAILPTPDGTVTLMDRAMLAYSWPGSFTPVVITKPIQARVPFTPPKVPAQYTQQWLQMRYGDIARAIPPVVTRDVVADTIVSTTDATLLCDTGAGDIDVELLPANQVQYLPLTIKNIGAGTVTVTGTVDATVDPTLAQWEWMVIQSNGVGWYLLGRG